jgi:hypothetical protein
MNRTAILLLPVFFGVFGAAAQTTFSVSATEVWKIAPHTQPDVEGHFIITNLTNQLQVIRWTRTVVSITPGCLSQVCDLNLCYTPPVSSRTFDLPPNEYGPIIMHFLNYDTILGAEAVIRLKMANENLPSDTVTVTFLFTSPLNRTGTPLPAAVVRAYPNPATDGVWLANADEVHAVRVLSLDGREVARFTAAPDGYYSLSGQPAGTYLLVLEDAYRRAFQVLEVVRR